jgi:hypothetical protein
MKRIAVAIIFTSLLCSFMTQAQTASESQSAVEITLGQKSVRGSEFVIEMGVIRDDEPFEVRLGLRNLRRSALNLELVSFPTNVSAEWVENIPEHKTHSHDVTEGKQIWFVVKYLPENNVVAPIVKIYNSGTMVAVIGFSLTTAPYEQKFAIGGRYSSNPRSKSQYSLPTGKLPDGYQLDCNSVTITSHSVGESHDWNCGKGLECAPTNHKACGSDGYSMDVTAERTGRDLFFDVALTATFRLAEPAPRLRLLNEISSENAIRAKRKECEDDWERFLEANKNVPQFKSVPFAGSYRTNACQPLQSSYLFGNTLLSKPAPEWTDWPYGGIRLKTSGKPILVGIIPQGDVDVVKDPYTAAVLASFSVYSAKSLGVAPGVTGVEIRIVRDGHVCAGTFQLSLNTDGANPVSLSVPVGMMTSDVPPAGMHVYTIQVRSIGAKRFYFTIAGSRLFAYELEHNENNVLAKSHK